MRFLNYKLEEDKILGKTQIWEYKFNLIHFYSYLNRELVHKENINVDNMEDIMEFKSLIFFSDEKLLKEIIKNIYYYNFLENKSYKNFCKIMGNKKFMQHKFKYLFKKDWIKYVYWYLFCIQNGNVWELKTMIKLFSSYKNQTKNLIKKIDNKLK